MRSFLITALFAISFLNQTPLAAQNKEFPHAISAKVNFLDYGLFYNREAHLSQGFEISYLRNVHPYVNIGVPVKIGISKLPPAFGKNMVTVSGDVIAQVSNVLSVSKVLPYAFVGAGIANDDLANTYFQIPLGAGIQYKVGKYASLAAQAEFRKSFENYRDNFQIGLGFVYLLHKPDAATLDTDKDGTPDVLDKCPTAAGPATALGCPDSDKDGVANSEDQCPELPGPLETNGCPDADGDNYPDASDKCPDIPGTLEGCPDTDKDGFSDDKDECPTVAGRWNGCPDTDLDGVADKNDQCPDEAGPVANNGCPEKAMIKDNDQDGVENDQDECPDQAGTVKGCPDADKDGIADKNDKCPNEAGVAAENGCPEKPMITDSDKDGVADENDECPEMAGTANGCPDADADGVADKNDKCPNQAGVAANLGCPEVKDADGDGFDDSSDACPFQAGTAKGCPDADGDGFADKDDPCPNSKGPLRGCPDTDGDGVADKDDKCPNNAGTFEGCPDTDKDGVADHKDQCPTVAAATANGCPEKPMAKDSDGDGVDDSIDRCPNTAGTVANSGCPEIKKETKERLAFAMQAVQFETGKANLKAQSFTILDEIVEIMRQYPDYKLAIGGHTDDIGDDDTNLRLSTERAKSCYDYLVFRGIAAARLRFAGFGEMRPIAENNSAAGRELNRRVEFELTLD